MFYSKWEKLYKLNLTSRQSRKMIQDMSEEERAELGLSDPFLKVYFGMVWGSFRFLLFPQLMLTAIFTLNYIQGNLAMGVAESLLLIASFSLLAFVLPLIVFGISTLWWYGSILVERIFHKKS